MNILNQADKKHNRNLDMFLKEQREKTMKETALLCFVGIGKNLETFEVSGLRTVKDLSCAHRQLKSP